MPKPVMRVLEALRWTGSISKGGIKNGEKLLCNRVLITSRGWTTKVEIVPAERPAMVSTSAGERRAWSSLISKCSVLLSC